MLKNISRRRALAAGALSAGLLTSVLPSKAYAAAGLSDVWGQDFLLQWSPPLNLKRELTPGKSHIRLSASAYRITNVEGTDYASLVKSMRAAGFTACEAGSSAWVSRKMPDSEIKELKAILKENDVQFYGLHCAGNIIAPTPDDEKWQRHIIDSINAAQEFDCSHVLTHAGSLYPSRNTPHPYNWSRESWNRSVNALKRIVKDTAGSTVDIALEDVNSESVNCPQAHVRMRQDVGDPRITTGLDPTNMMHAGVVFRTTELINTCFDLLADQISYVHAKDQTWSSRLPAIVQVMNVTGTMDYETFLVRMSRLKEPKPMYIEQLETPEEYAEARKNILAIAKKVGVTIYGA